MIAIFNVSLHESAHSFRIAHGLPSSVNELGTYLVQSNLGLPFKLKGETYDYVFGQRYVPHSLQQANDSAKAVGSSAYFKREYEEYLIGPYLEQYYEKKRMQCPEFYEFWTDYAYSVKKKDAKPQPATPKSAADIVKAAIESIALIKIGDALDATVNSYGIPDDGFNGLLKKAICESIKERLGLDDEGLAALLKMTITEVSKKYLTKKGAMHHQKPMDIIPPLYKSLEKMMGKPNGRKIPKGFGYVPKKNETEFFA